ncbi:hypothetical protein [Ancylobacter sp.]|uniref:hypothetical protein n=1 Tax=Ancylobacter sp. TaxID=1872567 RepID=UPI003D0CB675
MGNRRTTRAGRALRLTAGALLVAALGAGPALAQSSELSPGLTAGARKPVPQVPQSGLINDYPTVARADYVFGCMVANGQTRTALEKCSCSIDTIATILPYERYEEAETIMSVGQVAGQQAELFRSTGIFRDIVADLHRAQAEAEVTCFY